LYFRYTARRTVNRVFVAGIFDSQFEQYLKNQADLLTLIVEYLIVEAITG